MLAPHLFQAQNLDSCSQAHGPALLCNRQMERAWMGARRSRRLMVYAAAATVPSAPSSLPSSAGRTTSVF